MAHRVLVTDKLAEEGLARLRAEPGIEVVVDTKLAQDAAGLRQALAEADGIVIRSGTQLTAEVLEGQSRLKAIVRAGVGVDNIDVAGGDPARDRGDEHAGGQHGLHGRAHHGAAARAGAERGQGQRQPEGGQVGAQPSSPARSSRARRWASIGLGRVGLAVAKRAQGFGMTVVGFDPFLAAEKAHELRHRERRAARRPVGAAATSSRCTRR